MKINDLGEFKLIERLAKDSLKSLAAGVTGIGDDACVIPLSLLSPNATGNLLITTDLMVENKHFRTSYFSPFDLGWKLMAVNLSDIAAMGGKPYAALVTLQLRSDLDVDFVDKLYSGIYEHAAKYSVSIVGGDTTSGNEISLGVTLLGTGEAPILRGGAKVGDDIWVSGVLGQSRVALDCLENKQELPEASAEKFFRPQPRIDLAEVLAEENLAHAMIDVSDGLLQDLGHILKASKVAAELELESIPSMPEDLAKLAALSGGEDYELLFTATFSKRERLNLVPGLSRIGMIVSEFGQKEPIAVSLEDGQVVSSDDYLKKHAVGSSGFAHF